MKTKSLAFVVAASAGLVAASSAQVIDIVGSTAGRTAVINNVLALVNETSVAFSGAAATSSNQTIIQGTYNGSPVTVRFNFTGSAAGVQQVCQQLTNVSFYKTTIVANGAVAFNAANTETSAAEIGYSDVFQTTTSFTTPALTIEDEVAVIPFQFFKTENGAAGLTNITTQQVRQLFGTGEVPLSLFTGNALDTASVYATGRDASSGTRITTFAETGASQTSVAQYQPTESGGVVTALGGTTNSGFTSGSFVRTVLNATFASGTIVGYLGASDWPAASVSNAQPLRFNGVPYSTAALYNGQYTFWGYLHQFHQGVTGNTLTFYNALRDGMVTAPGSGVEPIGNMAADRLGDGFVVRPISL